MTTLLDDLRAVLAVLPPDQSLLLTCEYLRRVLADVATPPTAEVSAPVEEPEVERWFTAKEAGERLKLPPRWVHDHGKLLGAVRHSRNCTRYSSRAIDAYLAKRARATR